MQAYFVYGLFIKLLLVHFYCKISMTVWRYWQNMCRLVTMMHLKYSREIILFYVQLGIYNMSKIPRRWLVNCFIRPWPFGWIIFSMFFYRLSWLLNLRHQILLHCLYRIRHSMVVLNVRCQGQFTLASFLFCYFIVLIITSLIIFATSSVSLLA